jgi:hypothetical protein
MFEHHLPRRPVYGREHAAARPDERERRAQVRQAAEALFKPEPSAAFAQVAAIYGVDVGEIAKLFGKARPTRPRHLSGCGRLHVRIGCHAPSPVVRRFNTPADTLRLSERVVFNYTGLGARDLFGDVELIPVKGQLVVLLPQPEVTYNMIGDGIYAFPRHDGVLLRGTEQREVWSLAPDQAEVTRVLAAQKRVFASLSRRESVTAST